MSLPSQQKALLLSHSGPDAFYKVATRAIPQPAPDQVLVRNTAVALNPLDAFIRTTGIFVSPFGWPAIPGYDAAGEIAALGSNVQGWAVGDIVVYQGYFKADTGVFQEYTLTDAELIARVPSNISIDEAATLPTALATATCSLYHPADARSLGFVAPWEKEGKGQYAGQAALVIGGSSSVGQLTLQMLKLSGFSPIITTASGHNEAYCKNAGATHVIDYNVISYDALPSKLTELLNGTQLALVYDAISASESQKAAWAVTPPGSKMVITLPSVLGDEPEKDSSKTLVMAWGMFTAPENHEIGKRVFGLLSGLLESGDVKPNKVEVIPGGLQGIVAGLERIEAKKVSGAKLVVRPRETV